MTNFFCTSKLYRANIWHAFDMNENIATQKFVIQKFNFVNQINANYIYGT